MARQFTKGIDLVNAQRKKFEQLKLARRKAHQLLAEQARLDTVELLSGEPIGKARLQALRGHPFARGSSASASTSTGRRRGAAGSLPLLPIGQITGRLKKGIRSKPSSGRGSQSFDVGVYGVPYAGYVLGPFGTKKAVARGYDKEIKRRWKSRNKAFLDYYKTQQQRS